MVLSGISKTARIADCVRQNAAMSKYPSETESEFLLSHIEYRNKCGVPKKQIQLERAGKVRPGSCVYSSFSSRGALVVVVVVVEEVHDGAHGHVASPVRVELLHHPSEVL